MTKVSLNKLPIFCDERLMNFYIIVFNP